MEILIGIVVIYIVICAIVVILGAVVNLFKLFFELIVGIICLVVDFIKKYRTIITVVVGAIITLYLLYVYIRESDEPFAFIPNTWNNIMYGHEISGIIVGGVVTLLLNIFLIKLSKYIITKWLNVILFVSLVERSVSLG